MARPSLERRLPMMMTAILAVILIAALAATYGALRQAAYDAARGALHRGMHQVAALSDSSIALSRARYRAVAHDSAIHRALRTGRADSATLAALKRARLANDTMVPVELWSAGGRRIAFVGPDRSAARPPARDEPGISSASLRFEGIDSVRAVDTAQIGRLFASD